jgi:hypothetical protein
LWLSCLDLPLYLDTVRPKVLEYWQAIAKTPTSQGSSDFYYAYLLGDLEGPE